MLTLCYLQMVSLTFFSDQLLSIRHFNDVSKVIKAANYSVAAGVDMI